ncbi:chromosome segregation protein [Vairimorpha ceranae]|uniref:Chromosome segregation protein n=1 Tax=Vairimorpha ceranae TaxID=40302 RepID=A0A0F9WCZ7_9MICR|nr:chromosome segregation protein [Vairimorpha ceranae]KAF5140409.1 hypothetical protein G9O61_00g014250 [Vairimorpha ceranae]KKO74700.1 chromosome segregation protein [Vairimorpha ceranae]
MHIQKIEIENFKSFKSFTSIDLSPKFTIIIGKNGSGKSNIIHAIRTVICCEKLSREDRLDLIHENLFEDTTSISLFIDNSDKRLDSQKNIVIKRCINAEKDEYFLNEKLISRKDLKGFLENGGISSSSYFIVQQGKIGELINMTDKSRYELIKSISGAQKYEVERDNCLKMLNDAEITKQKYINNLRIIDDKLKNLESDKTKMEICTRLEKEKRRYEIAYLQKELIQINNKLEETEHIADNFTDSYEDVEYELKKISDKINELEYGKMQVEIYFSRETENLENINLSSKVNINPDLHSITNRLKEICLCIEKTSKQISEQEESFKKYKNEEREVFIEKIFLKNVISFLKEYDTSKTEDIEHIKELLKEKKRFIAENRTTKNIFNFKTLNKMIEKRKELWREEKKLIQDEKNLIDCVQSNENKLISSGHFSYKVYKDIKNEEGVVGCIFDLFDIPDDLLSAFEAVAGGFLFNIVVLDNNLIPNLLKKVNGSVTFIPLNKMTYEEAMEIEEKGIYLLSSKIKCRNTEYTKEMSALLSFITRNSYVVQDLRTGEMYSSKYNINIVTPEGDLIRKSGVITGGYDSKSSTIKEYKKIINKKNENKNKLEHLRSKISKISLEIETVEQIQKQNDGSFGEIDLLISITKFLEEKIEILKGKGHKLKYYENKLENILYKSLGLRSAIIKLESDLDDLKKELEDFNSEKVKSKNFLEILTKYKDIDKLKKKEKELKANFTNKNVKNEALILRKQHLLDKIGVNTEILFPELSEEQIANNLKNINEELKKYVFLNKRNLDQWNIFLEQKNDLIKRQSELLENYDTIIKFIKNLDEKKEEKMNLTFESVKENFDFFSKKLCNFDVCLLAENSKLSINVPEGDNKTLSGGQKTMVSIALILSIQKVDPSPFYIFDEIDANLDQEGRLRLSNLFSSIKDVQFIITTFREELLNVGDHFVGVSFSEKKSYASKVEKDVAHNFLLET